jgi:hypothetical protein
MEVLDSDINNNIGMRKVLPYLRLAVILLMFYFYVFSNWEVLIIVVTSLYSEGVQSN